ncbi:hypothetical protein EVAR_51211_1 [Eumeta japonica]|uniref:Uncharacterized protein n=1 Tax=Eumeta variegata TaxID=151549 RepID=A0A4C1ZCK5_EUMVA|nr:hypothetical protein EVAR_51211_1 [Eumeta japonica]
MRQGAPISRKRSVTPGFLGATRRVFTSCTDVSKTRFFSRPILKKNKKNPKIRGREVLVRDVRERRAIYRQKRALTTSSTPYPAHPYDFRFRGAPRKTGNLVSGDLFPGNISETRSTTPGFLGVDRSAPSRRTGVTKPKIFSWPVPEEIGKNPKPRGHEVPVPGVPGRRATRRVIRAPKISLSAPVGTTCVPFSRALTWPVPEKIRENRKPRGHEVPEGGDLEGRETAQIKWPSEANRAVFLVLKLNQK